jgi:uncharacterized protein (TIGR01777 family)
MQYRKIVLAGGNGYLGGVLARYYRPLAEEVILLSRTAAPPQGNIRIVVWDGVKEGAWTAELEHADLVVNLCGKNVNCRYTRENRRDILRSRIRPTALLGRVIRRLAHPPALWINITSATIYRHAEDRPQDEEHGELGAGFSVNICRSWERVFFAAETPGVRKVALRMGIVFGRADGVFPRLLRLVRFGMGGPQGNGRQYVSWIHETDAARVTEWLLRHPELEGPVNCTAPYPVPNEEQMRVIRKVYGQRWGLPVSTRLLSLGACLIGTETELILKSRWVLPRRLENAGFVFKYPHLEDAIAEISV